MKLHSVVLITLSSFLLLNVSNTSTYETREILPSTGLWNYLPIFGIWARIFHYLVTDSDGLGLQVKTLDKYFKNKYTPEKYVDLQNRVVYKLPKAIIIFRLLKIKENLRNVKDKQTGKTLGDALDILHELESDETVVNEIAERLNLVSPDKISMLGEPSMSNFNLKTTLKNTILENPAILGDVLKDPQVVNFISSSILQYLASDQVLRGIQSLQQMITMLEVAYPNLFQEGQNPIADIRDKRTGMSFIKTLETMVNIIESPKFAKELSKLLNTETLTYLHEKTQDVLSKVINNEHPGPKISAEEFVNLLNMMNIKLDQQTAENILKASREGILAQKANQFLKELKQIEDISAEKIVQYVALKGITINESAVKDAVNTITTLPPKAISTLLQQIGLNMSPRQIATLSEKVKVMKEKYEKNHPISETFPNPNEQEQDLTEGPVAHIHNDDSGQEEIEKSSEMM